MEAYHGTTCNQRLDQREGRLHITKDQASPQTPRESGPTKKEKATSACIRSAFHTYPDRVMIRVRVRIRVRVSLDREAMTVVETFSGTVVSHSLISDLMVVVVQGRGSQQGDQRPEALGAQG